LNVHKTFLPFNKITKEEKCKTSCPHPAKYLNDSLLEAGTCTCTHKVALSKTWMREEEFWVPCTFQHMRKKTIDPYTWGNMGSYSPYGTFF